VIAIVAGVIVERSVLFVISSSDLIFSKELPFFVTADGSS
jgi:hypothetical protein